MNRVGVVKSLYTNSAAVGALVIRTSNGYNLEKPSVVDLGVYLNDLTKKSLGHVNPRAMEIVSYAYSEPGINDVTLGYDGSSGNLVCVDPSISSNVNKFGTLSIKLLNNAGQGYTPKWGLSFDADVYIVQGDTLSSIYTRLVAEATKLVARVNAKYPKVEMTFTSSIDGTNKSLTFKASCLFNVTLDGIFDGTKHTLSTNDLTNLIGENVIVKEKEAAVLDGYNPMQNDKFQTFNIANYCLATPGKKYDAIIIRTTSDAKYESPTFHGGWDVEIELYCERVGNESDNELATLTQNIITVFKEIKDASSSPVSMSEVQHAIDAATKK